MDTTATTDRAPAFGTPDFRSSWGAAAAAGVSGGRGRTRSSACLLRQDKPGPFLTVLPPMVYTWDRRHALHT